MNERDKNITENIGLVYYTYFSFFKKYSSLKEDLIQEGTIALIKAHDTYNKNNKTKFSTFATKCIKNAMIDYIIKENKASNFVSIEKDKQENEIKQKTSCQNQSVLETKECIEKFISNIKNIKQRDVFRDVINNRIETGNTNAKEIAKKNNISITYLHIITNEYLHLLKKEFKK